MSIRFKKGLKYLNFVGLLSVVCLAVSCGGDPVPRPYGFFRVDLPAHIYRTVDTLGLPYTFDLPANARIISRTVESEKFWIDIEYSALKASVYCSYKPIKGNLLDLLEDTHRIVYKHSIKADGINEKVFESPDKSVHGILYDLKGNTASSIQFVLTDSTSNFFRGALYFDNVPNKDSIAPMNDYIREDIIRLMESFKWKK